MGLQDPIPTFTETPAFHSKYVIELDFENGKKRVFDLLGRKTTWVSRDRRDPMYTPIFSHPSHGEPQKEASIIKSLNSSNIFPY